MQKSRAWISMPASQVPQEAGIRRVIGGGVCVPELRWVCVLLRARESWLEALGDEERLKLEQRSVTFAGACPSGPWEQEEERSLMAGQRRTSACLSFRSGFSALHGWPFG